MKYTCVLIFMLSLLTYKSMYGQPYKSVFGKDTTQWNVVYNIPDAMPTIIYKAFGDTTINGENYKLIYKGYWYYFGDRYGYLREDTISGKLWLLTLDFNEQLIMDLSLTKSDTFTFATGAKYTVDTIFYKNNRKYISFNQGSMDSILFIEGIGPFNFLFPPQIWNPSDAQLRCMFKDNTLIYHNEKYENCIDTITGINKNEINNIKIYPNPTNKQLTIELNEEKPYTIELYNIMGLKISELRIINKAFIQVETLPSGLYFIRIRTKSGLYLSKFIKQ